MRRRLKQKPRARFFFKPARAIYVSRIFNLIQHNKNEQLLFLAPEITKEFHNYNITIFKNTKIQIFEAIIDTQPKNSDSS